MTGAPPTDPATGTTPGMFRTLRRYNLIAAALHAAQAIAVLLLANGFTLPVTATYMTGPPGTPPGEPTTLFDVRIAWGVAAFFGLSALAHLIVASPPFFARYVNGLRRHRNVFRWVEYSLSASVMMVLIAQIVGITDVTALLAIFGVNAAMILFGWLQEQYEEPGNGRWLPFVFGCVAGIVPWLAVAIYLLQPGNDAPVQPPGFVYAIFISLFVLFNIFAVNQWLQYRRVGRWSDYLVGERAYVTLSLVAKSLLAWQVFAGTLAG
ncbi:MAG TPA: heliorhodopsin HeR [Micromonosporaceae bacterium]